MTTKHSKQLKHQSAHLPDAGLTQPSGLNDWAGNTKDGIRWEVLRGDVRSVLKGLDENRFDCVVTSPPYYWLRDYKVDGQIGLESSIDGYVEAIADSMDGVQRVLKKSGVLFLNISDTYYSAKGKPKGNDKKNQARRFGLRAVDGPGLGVPRKTLIGIPWRVSLEMINRGWVLRSPIIWQREAAMPEPTAKDRPWRTYEMVLMFTKSQRYFFDRNALGDQEDIWKISSRPKSSNGLHAAAFPEELVSKCLNVGCPEGGEVLDPFVGTGTTLKVAVESQRPAVGIDLNKEYCEYSANLLGKL
ncbi:MAG: site-specific DNA-methyltransferase [Nitrospinae bacterium]|nr:site-specific DNA-methyltransferase [Nitrospinota bacterium]